MQKISVHLNLNKKWWRKSSLPQKFSGHGLPKLVVLLAMMFTRKRRSQRVQNKQFESMSLWLSKRKLIFTQHPTYTCVYIEGSKCIGFPAFLLELATVFLILEFHMAPRHKTISFSSFPPSLLSALLSAASRAVWEQEASSWIPSFISMLRKRARSPYST